MSVTSATQRASATARSSGHSFHFANRQTSSPADDAVGSTICTSPNVPSFVTWWSMQIAGSFSATAFTSGGIRANEKVAADRGRLAVERGPIVYCAEGADNAGGLIDAKLPADATFAVEAFAIGDKKFPALCASNGLLLVPYSLWGNRKPGNEMQT